MNRKCTGAMVGSHPFGGFNMSGTDSKSGGQDYLLLFLQAKTIAEKIRRHEIPRFTPGGIIPVLPTGFIPKPQRNIAYAIGPDASRTRGPMKHHRLAVIDFYRA